MKKQSISALIALAPVLLYSTVCLAEDLNKQVKFQANKDGGYESSAVTETKTDSGTSEVVKTREKVEVGKDGEVIGTIKTDTKTNPKGLLNETWKQEEATNKINPDGSAELNARTKGIDEAGTAVDSKLKTVSKIKEDGSTRTTSNLTTTVDPKGMMNKSVLETNKITDSAASGKTTTYVEKKVDGRVVEKTVE